MTDLIIKNNDIELTQSKEPRIDSRLVAEEMGITHKSLMNLIRSNKNDLKEFGSLPFQKASRKRGVGGVTITYALLNENQFDLI
ncbi:Rha family transcriptional regulator [Gilliamella apicola]|uniref:Rha family transcriptional regulator n=2 Tax=Gilliamella TaxID=1193503 RepID=UPI0039872BD4